MQTSWPWPDSSVDYDPQIGDGRKITAEEYAAWLLNFFSAGVVPVGNRLAVTAPDANEIAVNTGWAICAGRVYRNDSSLTLTPASAGAGSTRQDSVILQCDWTGGGDTEQYTVRAVTKAGTSGAPPSLTQTENVLWEERLYNYTIDDAGAITGITDARTMATFRTEISHDMLRDAIVDEDNLAASVAGDGLAGGAGSALEVNVDDSTIEISSDALRVKDGGIVAAKIGTSAVTNAKLAPDAVTNAKIADGAVTGGKISASSVDIGAKATAGSVNTAALAAGILSADAAGRGKMASGFFDAATLAAKISSAAFAATSAIRALFADAIWTNAKLAPDCARVVGELMENASATLGGTDGRRMVVGGVANESWVHCDGGAAVNGVTIPDLRGRVIAGVGGTYAKDATGGANTINIAHPHAVNINTGADLLTTGAGQVLLGADTFHHYHNVSGNTASALSAAQDVRQPTTYLYRFIYVG